MRQYSGKKYLYSKIAEINTYLALFYTFFCFNLLFVIYRDDSLINKKHCPMEKMSIYFNMLMHPFKMLIYLYKMYTRPYKLHNVVGCINHCCG